MFLYKTVMRAFAQKLGADEDESCWEDMCLSNISQYWWSNFLEFFIIAYSFIGLAIVCDSYLVKSLETLSARWHVKEDVAGAQFMAIGSAAPEITINAISTLKGANHVGLGLGAILGSGMIANLLVPACTILLIPAQELLLKRRPLLRDLSFYSISLASLIIIIHTAGVFSIYFSLYLLLIYVVYVIVLHWAPEIRRWWREKQGIVKPVKAEKLDFVRLAKQEGRSPSIRNLLEKDKRDRKLKASNSSLASSNSNVNQPLLDNDSLGEDVLQPDTYGTLNSSTVSVEDEEMTAEQAMRVIEASKIEDEEDEDTPLYKKIYNRLVLPLRLLFKYTCVDCELDGPYEKWYFLTFVVSVVWIALFSFVVSGVITSWVQKTGVANDFFGVTLVAISAEIPDTIQSITCSMRGYGSMAVGNFIGSQIVNICIGLGFPYFMSAAVGNEVFIDQIGITRETFVTSSAVIIHGSILLGAAWYQKTKKAILNKTKGAILLAAYIIGIIILGILELK